MNNPSHLAARRFELQRQIEIDAPIEQVFAHWTRYDDFPHFMESVRRIKRIDARHVLWDVDLGGRQLVWEALVEEQIPDKLVRWTTSTGARHDGEVRFEALSPHRTRVEVEIHYQPRGLLEHLGALTGVVGLLVDRDLGRFRFFVEQLPGDTLRGGRQSVESA